MARSAPSSKSFVPHDANSTIYWVVVSSCLFVLLSFPFAYQSTRQVLGPWVASPDGVPTPAGMALHTGVFLLALLALSYFAP